MRFTFWFKLKCKVSFLVIVLYSMPFWSSAQEKPPKTVENFCPYFKNRAPLPQPDLQNCTWYRGESCCLSKELNIILENIPPPAGANEKCLALLNRLMCYVCAPNQNLFYKDERLTVCIEFCDKLYQACGDATLKGSKVMDSYNTGTEFCLSRKFLVDSEVRKRCFTASDLDFKSSAALFQIEVWFVGLVSLIVAMIH